MIDSFTGEYFFLSNFCYAEVIFQGEIYDTVEHAFQAAKCANRDDAEAVRRAISPRQAKAIGRSVKIIPGWDDLRVGVMYTLVAQKFSYFPFNDKLRRTAGHQLIEGNTWGDTFWGQVNGIGENKLGKILMIVRDRL